MDSPFGNGDGAGSSRPSSSSSFRDRFMGKSSAEVLGELQNQFDREREMFFQNRPFGNRETSGFADPPFGRRFFERTGRFSDPTPPEPSPASTTASSSSSTSSGSCAPEPDPFQGRDSIPIKVIHEYTSAKPPKGSSSSSGESKLRPNSTDEKLHPPQKSASAHEVPVQPARKQQMYQKSSSAGVETVPVTLLKQEPSQQQAPKREAQTPPLPPAIQVSLEKIARVEAALSELSPALDAFSGLKNSKDYLYLDEMLTRNLIKLDDVETHGDERIRSQRKATVRKIEKLVEQLESSARIAGEAKTTELDVPSGSMREASRVENGEERGHPGAPDSGAKAGDESVERIYDPMDEGTTV